MYCSNKQFLAIAKKNGVNYEELYPLVAVIFALYKKYGNLLKSQSLQEILEKVNPQISKLIYLLQSIDKLDASNLREMITLLKQQRKEKLFIVRGLLSDEMIASIEKKLKQQFNDVHIDTKKTEQAWFYVAWEWWYYKRNLERDLGKMLG